MSTANRRFGGVDDHAACVGDHVGIGAANDVVHADRRQDGVMPRSGIDGLVSLSARIEHVEARPAVQRVAAGAAPDDVVPAADGDHVIAAAAIDPIVAIARGDMVAAAAAHDRVVPIAGIDGAWQHNIAANDDVIVAGRAEDLEALHVGNREKLRGGAGDMCGDFLAAVDQAHRHVRTGIRIRPEGQDVVHHADRRRHILPAFQRFDGGFVERVARRPRREWRGARSVPASAEFVFGWRRVANSTAFGGRGFFFGSVPSCCDDARRGWPGKRR